MSKGKQPRQAGPPPRPANSGSVVLNELMSHVEERELPLVHVSVEMGFNKHAMGNWRAGRNKPSIHSVEALADYLGFEFVLKRKDEK